MPIMSLVLLGSRFLGLGFFGCLWLRVRGVVQDPLDQLAARVDTAALPLTTAWFRVATRRFYAGSSAALGATPPHHSPSPRDSCLRLRRSLGREHSLLQLRAQGVGQVTGTQEQHPRQQELFAP